MASNSTEVGVVRPEVQSLSKQLVDRIVKGPTEGSDATRQLLDELLLELIRFREQSGRDQVPLEFPAVPQEYYERGPQPNRAVPSAENEPSLVRVAGASDWRQLAPTAVHPGLLLDKNQDAFRKSEKELEGRRLKQQERGANPIYAPRVPAPGVIEIAPTSEIPMSMNESLVRIAQASDPINALVKEVGTDTLTVEDRSVPHAYGPDDEALTAKVKRGLLGEDIDLTEDEARRLPENWVRSLTNVHRGQDTRLGRLVKDFDERAQAYRSQRPGAREQEAMARQDVLSQRLQDVLGIPGAEAAPPEPTSPFAGSYRPRPDEFFPSELPPREYPTQAPPLALNRVAPSRPGVVKFPGGTVRPGPYVPSFEGARDVEPEANLARLLTGPTNVPREQAFPSQDFSGPLGQPDRGTAGYEFPEVVAWLSGGERGRILEGEHRFGLPPSPLEGLLGFSVSSGDQPVPTATADVEGADLWRPFRTPTPRPKPALPADQQTGLRAGPMPNFSAPRTFQTPKAKPTPEVRLPMSISSLGATESFQPYETPFVQAGEFTASPRAKPATSLAQAVESTTSRPKAKPKPSVGGTAAVSLPVVRPQNTPTYFVSAPAPPPPTVPTEKIANTFGAATSLKPPVSTKPGTKPAKSLETLQGLSPVEAVPQSGTPMITVHPAVPAAATAFAPAPVAKATPPVASGRTYGDLSRQTFTPQQFNAVFGAFAPRDYLSNGLVGLGTSTTLDRTDMVARQRELQRRGLVQ